MVRSRETEPTNRESSPAGYSLDWPTWQRWNPRYNVPRNSLEDEFSPLPTATGRSGLPDSGGHVHEKPYPRLMSYGRSTRDLDTNFDAARPWRTEEPDEAENEFSSLAHWLDALSEIYMNNLDNRARWEPRWLNITSRERFEGLTSVRMSVLDYCDGEANPRCTSITTKQQLAAAVQERPAAAEIRVILVSDLSRFVMGALGHLCSVDPEFWFEHLVQSGYRASDSGLKLKNAAWLNWVESETRFRHRVLPGVGQRTEWNVRRRVQGRTWVHLRWGRLGLLNYLGRKGFHEDEIEKRLADGRWLVEQDVILDKHGLLMTAKRKARSDKEARKRAKKEKVPQPAEAGDKDTSVRYKTANVYRPYSTFDPLPMNPPSWQNRDLRVMAPEGLSYWSGRDEEGRKTIIILVDPQRSMKQSKTGETTPSLTFMPRALEWEAYDDERRWQFPEPSETYLDPPPPTLSKKDRRKQEKEAERQKPKNNRNMRRRKSKGRDTEKGEDSESLPTSDSEYDKEYEDSLRTMYQNPKPYTRHRDYARKYAWSTFELLQRGLTGISTAEMLQGGPIIPPLVTRMCLDDLWQLLAEMRMGLDRVDNDLGASLSDHLLENSGTKTRQNVVWMRSTLRDIHDWAKNMTAAPAAVSYSEDASEEITTLVEEVEVLQARVESTSNLLMSFTGLAQSSLVIDQTSGVNKLTELAFFFVPISFITSVFSMQVVEFSTATPSIWVWGVCLVLVFLASYLVRITLRSPTVRVLAMRCRVTILNRFTSSNSSARRLNSVGNTAVAKFLVLFFVALSFTIGLLCLAVAFMFLVFAGIWLAAAGTALYFIITRWPEPSALVPGFISLLLAAGGVWASWCWRAEINALVESWVMRGVSWLRDDALPASWVIDRVEDEDLAKEGINTYARQAIVLTTS
ncbi:hypothetical protein GQ53DRAFT_717040 [Thozetella sp. PMI_491]|nr:hypothetical protein GQ53DRAFT_717040 [Thozetella sp. PMI_491]